MTKRKRKQNIPIVPIISSADEAEEAVNKWYLGSPSNDPYDGIEASDTQMNRLRELIRKIWEDAYATGRDDASSDAAVYVAEAEWFGG